MRLNLKFNREDPNTYRCCVCCHVRTGTVIIGLWHLLLQSLAIGLVILIQMKPELLEAWELEVSGGPNTTVVDDQYKLFSFRHRKWTSDDRMVALLLALGYVVITVMLVFGAIRGRPGYLMPFFCLKVFDFCITCLSIVGYFSYLPDIKRWIAAQEELPFREYLLKCDGDWLMLMIVAVFVLVMTVKAYFIGVVWACYKYLQTRNVAIVRSPEYSGSDDAEMLLPPKYEDVLRMSAEEPSPPPYQP